MNKKVLEMLNEQFDGNTHRALTHINKIQKQNKFLHEEHMRMGRNDKADVVMGKIKSNNEVPHT